MSFNDDEDIIRGADAILELIQNGNVSDFLETSSDEEDILLAQQPAPRVGNIEARDEPVDEPVQVVQQNRLEVPIAPPPPEPEENLNWDQRSKFVRPQIEEKEFDPRVYDYQNIYQYFLLFIDDVIIEQMANCTNLISVEVLGRSINVSTKDMKIFLGISYIMSCLNYPQIRLYWSKNFSIPVIKKAMSRNRYLEIRRFLKVVDDNRVPEPVRKHDVAWKVRPLLDRIRSGCLQLVRPTNMCIDEQMIPFHGRCNMRQFVPNKPNPVGLKNFILADKDGLVLDFLLYQGKKDSIDPDYSNLNIGEATVMKLSESVPKKSCLYFDRYFTTVRLLNKLKRRKIYGTGTLKSVYVPKKCKLLSLKAFKKKPRGFVQQFVRSDKKMCLIQWNDNKPVLLLSTRSSKNPVTYCTRWSKVMKRRIQVKRPNLVKLYNELMGGVDLIDRFIAYYRMSGKTRKWTYRVIMHFFDLAMCQAWILHKKKEARISLFNFKLKIAQHLIEDLEVLVENLTDEEVEANQGAAVGPVPLPSLELRSRRAEHMPEYVDSANAMRCRREGCRKKRRVICTTCNVILCFNSHQNCFKTFHEPLNHG